MDKKFVVTTSAETAEKLKTNGYQLLQYESGKWTFLYDNRIRLSEYKNLTFSNLAGTVTHN